MWNRWSLAICLWLMLGLCIGGLTLNETYPGLFRPLLTVTVVDRTEETLTTGHERSQADSPISDDDQTEESEPDADADDSDTATELSAGSEDGETEAGGLATTGESIPDLAAVSPEVEGLMANWALNDGEEVPFIGYRGEADYSVTLPPGWEATGARLTGQVSASEQARADTSLRIDVAGRPIGSWSDGQPTDINFPISFDRPDKPEIPIDFVTTTPLTEDGACTDPSHVARWLEIDNVSVSAQVRPVKLDVTRTIRGLGTISAVTAEPIHVIVDGRPTPDVLETVGNLAGAIGHYGLPDSWRIRFDGAEPTEPGAQIRITEDPDVPARVSVRVVDHRPVMEIVGRGAGLKWLTEAMSDLGRIDYFHYGRVAAEDVPRGADYPIREVFRFEDDGYDDRTLRGSGDQSLVYRVHIPAGVPPDAATLALYATHSPSLANAQSTISVRINGSPEEIVALASEEGQIDVLHTVAPAELRPGLNYVKITTQLAGPPLGGGSCGSERGAAWFTISNVSGLGVERESELQTVRLGVEDARFALATPVDFYGTDVAIPSGLRPLDVELAASIISQLSHRAQGGSPRLVIDKNADLDRHLVVVGADLDRDLLDTVPKVTRDGAAINESTAAAQTLGMVAAEPSPFTDGKVLLAFTGPSRAGAARAAEAALSSDVNDITSNHALVSPDTVRPIRAEEVRFQDFWLDGQDAPSGLAYADETGGIPEGEAYDEWVLDQAERIEAAQETDRDQRRIIALCLLVFASLVAGLWWVHRARQKDQAGGH